MTPSLDQVDFSWSTGITLLDSVGYLASDGVHIFDRRAYPFQTNWVVCRDVEEVASAIENMVTQSRAPGVIAWYGMLLAAREALGLTDAMEHMQAAGRRLIATRPTNDAIGHSVRAALAVCAETRQAEWPTALRHAMETDERERRSRGDAIGRHGACLLGEHPRILTNCWGETGLPQIVLQAVSDGKAVEVYCPETRPYLQGARLTADALRDAGAKVTVVPDSGVGYLVSERLVDLALVGSDRVAADGGVVNKIGTLTIATLCRDYGVPFYAVCQGIDASVATVADVPVEMRDGREALECLGHRTATHDVNGLYPAFDRTPSRLVTGLVMANGVVTPAELSSS